MGKSFKSTKSALLVFAFAIVLVMTLAALSVSEPKAKADAVIDLDLNADNATVAWSDTTTIGNHGVETIEEIQPSDIKEGAKVTVMMAIPEQVLSLSSFKVMQITENGVEYVEYEIKGDYIVLSTDTVGQYAFVADKDTNKHGFCIGWFAFILMMLELLYLVLFAILWIGKPAKAIENSKLNVLTDKFAKVIEKCRLTVLLDKVDLLGIAGLAVAAPMFIVTLFALCFHACAASIIAFIFALLILAAFIAWLLIEYKDTDTVQKIFKFFKEIPGKVSKVFKKGDKEAETEAENEKVAGEEIAEDVAAEKDVEVKEQDEDVAVENDEEIGKVVVDENGNYFSIRYNKSFTAKLAQSPEKTKLAYSELKNDVLSHSKAKSRVSWACDSINAGRKPIVKFGIRGKTLCVYFPLNAEELEGKYKVEKVDAAKYESVPYMYRIKNDRRLRYAHELIEKVCEQAELKKGETPQVDYTLPYESTQALIEKGLIKELKVAVPAPNVEPTEQEYETDSLVKAISEQIEVMFNDEVIEKDNETQTAEQVPATDEVAATACDEPVKEDEIKKVEQVSASEVGALISDETASAAIIKNDKTETKRSGKKAIINVDTLSANFNNGDVVTIEALKKKRLISANIGQVKLLARGNLDKVLHVELQDYSLDAVKMIIATGGTVKRC